jgi:hypothetical protein
MVMRALLIAALITLSAMAGLTYAQRAPQRAETDITQPTQISIEMLLEEQRTTCYLPDDSKHPLNTATSYDGQRYRCVEVYAPYPDTARSGQNQILRVRMAGWVRVP